VCSPATRRQRRAAAATFDVSLVFQQGVSATEAKTFVAAANKDIAAGNFKVPVIAGGVTTTATVTEVAQAPKPAPAVCTTEIRLCKDGSQMPRAKDCTWLPEKCKILVVGGPCITEHGCCKDKQTAKKDAGGSNCDENQPITTCADFSGLGMYGKCTAKKASGCKWFHKDKVCYSGAAPPATAVLSDKTDCSVYTGVGMYSKCKKHFDVCTWQSKNKACLAKNAAPKPEAAASGCTLFSGKGMYKKCIAAKCAFDLAAKTCAAIPTVDCAPYSGVGKYSKCKKQGSSCKWVTATKTCASAFAAAKPATAGACSDHSGKGKYKYCRDAAGCEWNNTKKECFSTA